jgi:hypothetical protein
MPLTNFAIEGTLYISGVNMNRPAWAVLGDERGKNGLVPLWIEADVRGDDRLLPSVTGVIPYRRRITVTRHDLRILVAGDVDVNGAPVANPTIGLENNLTYLRTNVVAPVASATGTRSAILTMPSGVTRTADIHVLDLVVQSYMFSPVVDGCSQGALLIGILQISIPSGRFT